MVKLRPSKFGAPAKRSRCKAAARDTNQAHRKIGLHASVQSHSPRTTRLRDLEQSWTYPDIVRMTNVAAKKMLVKHGILKAPKDKMYCWQCGSLMSYASSSSGQSSNAADTMQCANCTVAGRHKLQVKAVSLSYSPFWKTHRSGHEISYDLFLRTAFLHGIRTPVDAMQQLVPESGKHVTNQTVRKWVDHMNFCLAYSVTRHCHYVKFEFLFSLDIPTCFKDLKYVSCILILMHFLAASKSKMHISNPGHEDGGQGGFEE